MHRTGHLRPPKNAPKTRSPRGDNKQPTLIAMLRVLDGAIIDEIIVRDELGAACGARRDCRYSQEATRVRGDPGEDRVARADLQLPRLYDETAGN